MLNFKGKKWPASPLKAENLDAEQLKQFLQIRADYEKSAFVSEGHVEVRALGAKEFTAPIPPGESAISALTNHFNGHIYGGTSGKKAHLFFYNPAPDADAIADIGVVAENASICKLITLSDGRVIGAANEKDKGGFIFCYKPCEVLLREEDFSGLGVREIFDLPAEDQLFFSTIDPCHSAGKIERFKTPVINEDIADLVVDEKSGKFYYLGGSSGTLFSYDPATEKTIKIGRLDSNGNFSKKLVMDDNGIIYGNGLYGRFFSCVVGSDKLESMDLLAPAMKGRELYNKVTSWTRCDNDGIIYGGTIDGIVFKFIPQGNRLICLGKPVDQGNMRTLTIGDNGIVYGIVGEEGKCCHLISYNDSTRELRDLGCLLARSERPWNGYEFSSAVTGVNGTIFLGESDRISHLFMYFPPSK